MAEAKAETKAMARCEEQGESEAAQAQIKPIGLLEQGGRELSNAALPKREAWLTTASLSKFQGCCWLGQEVSKSVALVQAEFQPRPDDIILATFPKCGTTWLKALAFTILNRSRYAVGGGGGGGDDTATHPLLTNLPHALVADLEFPLRQLHPVAELEALPSPRLLCTHLPLALLSSGVSALGCRIVYLCREPKDVLVSTWHYMNKVYPDEFFTEFGRAFELFCEGVSVYGPLWNHYLGYWKQSLIEPGRVLFLKYEEMMADTASHVKMLAEFMRAPFTTEENSGLVQQIVKLCSFDNLKQLPVNSSGVTDPMGGLVIENSVYFRTAKVGDWENYRTQEMADKLDRVIEEKLGEYGLTF